MTKEPELIPYKIRAQVLIGTFHHELEWETEKETLEDVIDEFFGLMETKGARYVNIDINRS